MSAIAPLDSSRAPGVGVDLVALRRRLHASPEIALDLPATRAILLEVLDPLPVEVHTWPTSSAVAVVVRAERSGGPTVLLRADMDALPVVEPAGADFAATNGNMHACGHDLHMAGLVGAVIEVVDRRAELRGDVLAVFQPGEESAGGAELLLREGILAVTGSTPVASFGVHVLSYRPAGVFSCRAGAVMGAVVNLELVVRGRGGHAARPHTALDPVTVAATVVQGIQTFVAQRGAPDDPLVVTVGALHAGSAANVIPSEARLSISLRAVTSDRARSAADQVVAVSRGLCEAYGLTVAATRTVDLPETVSDVDGAALVEQVVVDLFGASAYAPLVAPEMIAEDFSLFLERTGGAFALVGAAVGERPEHELATNHSAQAQFDDAVVARIARVLAEVAVRRLAAGPPVQHRAAASHP
ncbi:M20 metallopeptidase family protein [Jatrophihabitans sp. YIM 134969]